jgi:putative Ca2+/H+ antiporter (TMEM165/GDT1 family)
MFILFFAAYSTVFVAEIVGDKLLYTTGVLATRYRPLPIILGVTIAFMAKMGVAVLIGDAIAHLPALIVAAVTAASFFGVAYTVWRKPVTPSEPTKDVHPTQATMVSFATVFFSEWGDVGQITAAALTARYHAPLIVWLGAVCAMITKGALAASAGAGIRSWIQSRISPEVIRYAGVAALLVLGCLSVLETLGYGD